GPHRTRRPAGRTTAAAPGAPDRSAGDRRARRGTRATPRPGPGDPGAAQPQRAARPRRCAAGPGRTARRTSAAGGWFTAAAIDRRTVGTRPAPGAPAPRGVAGGRRAGRTAAGPAGYRRPARTLPA